MSIGGIHTKALQIQINIEDQLYSYANLSNAEAKEKIEELNEMLDFLIKLTAADPGERYIGKGFCRIATEVSECVLPEKNKTETLQNRIKRKMQGTKRNINSINRK